MVTAVSHEKGKVLWWGTNAFRTHAKPETEGSRERVKEFDMM